MTQIGTQWTAPSLTDRNKLLFWLFVHRNYENESHENLKYVLSRNLPNTEGTQ